MSKTYCSEPWRTIHVDTQNRYGPCCTFKKFRSDQFNNVEEYWNSSWLKDIRQKMLRGESVNGCENCYKKEARNEVSQRIEKNSKYGYVTDPVIDTLYFTFGNLCNKTCNICRPSRSHLIAKQYSEIDKESTWYTENVNHSFKEKSLKALINPDFDSKIEDIQYGLADVKTIHLNGGEPFLTKHCISLLDYLIQNNLTDKIICATTNGSLEHSHIEKLKQFKDVKLGISIDGIEELYECVRSPHDWNWWNTHHNRILQENFERTYLCVVNAFNVHQLPRMVNYFLDCGGNFYFSALNNQDFLGPDNAPVEILTESVAQLENLKHVCNNLQQKNIANVQSILGNAIAKNRANYKVFSSFVTEMSKIKKINYQEYLPWTL